MFRATIKDASIYFPTLHASARWQEWMEAHEGARIVIEEEKPVRSHSQNAYYWVYLGVIERETGNNANDLHEYFKRVLLPPVHKTVLGKEIKLPASTTDLDKSDFTIYLDKICALTNVPIPNPEDAGYISNTAPIIRPQKAA